MSEWAMLPCIKCGIELKNVTRDASNQPQGGTEFRTFGHYGSTFWDSFEGEQIVINVCDTCLGEVKRERVARQKSCISLKVGEWVVGRQWVWEEMVPWFDGHEDESRAHHVDPEEIGILEDPGGRIEWVQGWRELRDMILEEREYEKEKKGD